MSKLTVLFLMLTQQAMAAEPMFKPSEGLVYKTADLIENDRGLMCVGYSKEDCAKAEFRLVAGGIVPDQNGKAMVQYDVVYTLAQASCVAHIGKYQYQDGWMTLSFKSSCNPR